MTAMWLGMVALSVVAILVMARPWLSSRLPAAVRRRAANVAAYRTRVAEIEADCIAGLITADTANTLREEQARRLLADADTPSAEPDTPAPAKRRRLLGLSLALLPVVIAGLGYLHSGSWRAERLIAAGAPSKTMTAGRIHSMIHALEGDLKAHPDDANEWALLGRGRQALKDYAGAARAYRQANVHSGHTNPDWLVAQGQALALANGHDLQGRPATLFKQALGIAPDNPRALWYAGLAAAQAGDRTHAVRLWKRLANQSLPPAAEKALAEAIRREEGKGSGNDAAG